MINITQKTYFVGGEITPYEEVKKILNGEGAKKIYNYDSKSTLPILWLTDELKVAGNKLDESDPLLKKALDVLNTTIDETFIIQLPSFKDSRHDPLINNKRVAIYLYK